MRRTIEGRWNRKDTKVTKNGRIPGLRSPPTLRSLRIFVRFGAALCALCRSVRSVFQSPVPFTSSLCPFPAAPLAGCRRGDRGRAQGIALAHRRSMLYASFFGEGQGDRVAAGVRDDEASEAD